MAEEIKSNPFSETMDSPNNIVPFDNMATQIPETEKYDFDLRGALQEGYSEEDIAKYLAGEFGYDYNKLRTEAIDPTTGTRAEVYSDRDIINTFTKMRDVSQTDYMVEEFKKGLAKGVPGAAGAKVGLKAGINIGSKVHPIYGTLGGGALGLVLGGGLGFGLGEEYIEKPFLTEEGNVPIEYYGFGRFSEALGEMLPFAANPYYYRYNGLPPSVADYLDNLAVQGGKKIQKFFASPIKFFDNIGRKVQTSQQTSPKLFLGAELSATTGAATGSGVAETITKTDNPWAQTTGELVGGVLLSPSSILVNSYNVLKGLGGKLTKEGRLTTVGNKLIKRFQEFEELPDPSKFSDPNRRAAAKQEFDATLDRIIADLETDETDFDQLVRDMGLPLVTKPSALKSNSKTLMALHNKYATRKAKEGDLLDPSIDLSRQKYEKVLITLQEIFSRVDDPAALSEAAKLREVILKNSILDSIYNETGAAVKIADKYLEGSKVDAAEKAGVAGKIIYTRLNALKKELREQESKLYNQIDKNQELDVAPLKKTILELFKGYDPKERDALFDPTSRVLIKKIIGEDEISIIDKYQKQLNPIQNRIKNAERREEELSATYPSAKENFETYLRRNGFYEDMDEGVLPPSGAQPFTNKQKEVLSDLIEQIDRRRFRIFPELSNSQINKVKLLAENRIKSILDQNRESGIIADRTNELSLLDKGVEGEDVFSFATVGELQDFKKKMYSGMMSAMFNDPTKKGIYSKLHQSVYDVFGTKVDDLKKLSENQKLDTNQQNLIDAFSFSKAFNDSFTRRYTGRILEKFNDQGFGNTKPPELLAEDIFVNSPIDNKLRTGQIKNAIDFYRDQLPEGKFSDLTTSSLQGQLETILKNLIIKKEIVNPEVLRQIQTKDIDLTKAKELNLIDEKKLNTFLSEQGSELEAISPTLYNDLQDMKKANLLVKNILTKDNPFSQSSKDILAFSEFIGAEDNPAAVIRRAIGTPNKRSDNALKKLNSITDEIIKGTEDVKKGFTQIALQDAFQYASSLDKGGFDFVKFKNYLKQPLQPGKEGSPSLISVMKNKNIITEPQYRALTMLMNEFEKVQKLDESGKIAGIEDLPSVVTTLYVKLLGSGFGTTLGDKLSRLVPFIDRRSGAGLIEASAGVRAAEELLVGMPQTYFTNFVNEVIKNPKQMALVLRKAKNAKDWFSLHKQFNSYLDSIGISAVGESEGMRELVAPTIEEETPPPPLPTGVPEEVARAPMPPRAPQQVAMASPPPPAPKPDMASRARFQQLFPMDIASQTMTQTAPPMRSGIGSLV